MKKIKALSIAIVVGFSLVLAAGTGFAMMDKSDYNKGRMAGEMRAAVDAKFGACWLSNGNQDSEINMKSRQYTDSMEYNHKSESFLAGFKDGYHRIYTVAYDNYCGE